MANILKHHDKDCLRCRQLEQWYRDEEPKNIRLLQRVRDLELICATHKIHIPESVGGS